MNDYNPKTPYDDPLPETMECNYTLWKDFLWTMLLVAIVSFIIIVLPEIFS